VQQLPRLHCRQLQAVDVVGAQGEVAGVVHQYQRWGRRHRHQRGGAGAGRRLQRPQQRAGLKGVQQQQAVGAAAGHQVDVRAGGQGQHLQGSGGLGAWVCGRVNVEGGWAGWDRVGGAASQQRGPRAGCAGPTDMKAGRGQAGGPARTSPRCPRSTCRGAAATGSALPPPPPRPGRPPPRAAPPSSHTATVVSRLPLSSRPQEAGGQLPPPLLLPPPAAVSSEGCVANGATPGGGGGGPVASSAVTVSWCSDSDCSSRPSSAGGAQG
jgi:hypothetical protein